MKKIKNILDSIVITNLVESLPKDKQQIFIQYLTQINLSNQSYSQCICRIKNTIIPIILQNDNKHLELIQEYYETNSKIRKLQIKYGNSHADDYCKRLKERPVAENTQPWTKEYWMSRKGFSEEESIRKSKEISNKRIEAFRNSNEKYRPSKKTSKISIEYWTNSGYSEEEAEILRQPYLDKCKNDLNSLIKKYGFDIGTQKYNHRITKYKNSMEKNKHNRKTAGYVSKESIKFFIPLYKFCRKLGLERQDINFGIRGSREYFIRDNNQHYNSGKFYDFTIPKLNIIIEYNGIFWHPRNINEWKNPFIEFELAKSNEEYKISLAKSRGFEYYEIWNDDNLDIKLQEMKNIIEGLYEQTK